MTVELIGAMLFFILTVFALIFSLTKSSHVEIESFPNRGRFFAGLILWTLSSMQAVFMSFPGYSAWFVPIVYPIMKVTFAITFLVGFFMVLTTVNAFPIHMDAVRREIAGRSDRIALLENIRRIASQPYPITELFTLTLKELGSFLVVKKGAVFLINPSNREMYLVAQIGLTQDEISRLERFAIGQDIISRAAAEQMPFISGDLAASDSATRRLILAGRDLTMSAAAMPLSSRDRSLGAMLVLSDKPYSFEKQERLILSSAAEAVAAEIESNRLIRDNQKLSSQLTSSANRLERLIGDINQLATEKEARNILNLACKAIVERYGVTAARVVQLNRGELQELVKYELNPTLTESSESYRIAIIDAIRRKKMVVLNQEAKNRDGNIFINRSTLLCPFNLWSQRDFALLIEAPGNGLPLNDVFLRDVEVWVSMLTVSQNISGLREAESLGQSAVKSLLNILHIEHKSPTTMIYRKFIDEAVRIVSATASVVVFIPDQQNGYRALDGYNVPSETMVGATFLPGEGPIGKTGATGKVLELNSPQEIENAWQDLEPANEDFIGRLFAERGVPTYQLNIPVTVLDTIAAIISVFDHGESSHPSRREKGLLLLAAQLLSIKLSMARMDEQVFETIIDGRLHQAGGILNRLNNDLATIIGRIQLLERQSDISGRTRYTAGEILKASENAAEMVQRLQEGFRTTELPTEQKSVSIRGYLDEILDRRLVTGNIYMFDDNKAVTLQADIDDNPEFSPSAQVLKDTLETALKKFVSLVDENQEVKIKSELRNGFFYLSLIRGNRDDFTTFDPASKDFGDPDVLPSEFVDDKTKLEISKQKGEVSFDRFGRRPTYLSFRFPESSDGVSEKMTAGDIGGQLTILAIDDQQMILDLLSGICNSLGINLTAVKDPRQGLDLFRRQSFDIVMVDLVMDGLSGWDVTKAVKQQSPNTPVILMTGWGVALTETEIRRAGVDFTLTKPFKIEQLTDIIAKARRKHALS